MPPKAKADAKAKAKGEPKKKQEKEEEEENKLKQPDRDAYQKKLTALQEEIDDLQKEKQRVNDQIGQRSSGKDEFFTQKEAIRAQLNQINEQLDAHDAKKGAIDTDIVKKKQETVDARNQINKMKRSIGYESETAIDERIATIEWKLHHESVSLKEEKKFLQEITELKRNRPKVNQVQSLEQNLNAGRDSGTTKEDLNQIGFEMFQLREKRREISKQLKDLVDSRFEFMGDVDSYQTQRQELNALIKTKIEEKNKVRDEQREEERKYYEQRDAERQKRAEKQKEGSQNYETEREQIRREAKAEKMDQNPYLEKMTLIEQTISFCKSLVPDKGPEVKEEKEKKDLNVVEGAEVLVKKEDREEFYFAPTGKSKKKSGKKAKGEGAAKPIRHNAETFRLFYKLKIEAPITTDDVPSRLEQLEQQLEDYRQKVEAWEKTREQKKEKILRGEYNEEEEEKKVQPDKVEAQKDDKDGDEEQGGEQEGGADATEEGKAED